LALFESLTEEEEEQRRLTSKQALFFVVYASTMLFLLFYFKDYLLKVFTGLITFSSSFTVAILIEHFFLRTLFNSPSKV